MARPPGRTARIPACTAAATPEASMNAFTSRPSIKSTRGSRATVAPCSRANARRSSSISLMYTVVAPKARAVCAMITPIGPAPAMSTLLPGRMSARLHAQMPTERGSMSAAASSEMLSGIAWAKSA